MRVRVRMRVRVKARARGEGERFERDVTSTHDRLAVERGRQLMRLDCDGRNDGVDDGRGEEKAKCCAAGC